MLVDGLDEYDGDLANLFQALAKPSNVNVKACLSSRPLIAFKDSFSFSANLRLQDFTYNDIKHYVNSKFNSHARFQHLMIREPECAPALIDEIVLKAEGVFLWVRLVCNPS